MSKEKKFDDTHTGRRGRAFDKLAIKITGLEEKASKRDKQVKNYQYGLEVALDKVVSLKQELALTKGALELACDMFIEEGHSWPPGCKILVKGFDSCDKVDSKTECIKCWTRYFIDQARQEGEKCTKSD